MLSEFSPPLTVPNREKSGLDGWAAGESRSLYEDFYRKLYEIVAQAGGGESRGSCVDLPSGNLPHDAVYYVH